MTYFVLFLAFVILQRMAELLLARRNESWLRQHGAREFGHGHYPFLIALHAAFFLSLILEVLFVGNGPASWWWLPCGLFVCAQVLRYWSIASLGRRWNTKIMVLPDAPPLHRGPYRFLRHPNYVAVAVELLVIPLMWQAYFTAVIFTLLNALIMSVRIPTETRALSPPPA